MGIALTEMDSAGLLVEMLYEQGRPVTEVLVAAPGSTGCSGSQYWGSQWEDLVAGAEASLWRL